MILSELVMLTEYSRAYASRVLRQHGQRMKPGETIVGRGCAAALTTAPVAILRRKVQAALIRIWRMMDYICGKRLQPALPELLTVLERHNELQRDRLTKQKLLRIRAATTAHRAAQIRVAWASAYQTRNTTETSDSDPHLAEWK